MRISKKEQQRLDAANKAWKIHDAVNGASNSLRIFLKEQAAQYKIPLESFSFYLLLEALSSYRENYRKVTVEDWD